MPVFAYRGLTAGGHAEHGVVDADTARAAWQALRTRGIYPTAITSAGGATAPARVPAPELAFVTRRLATLLAAGLPLTEALAAAGELSSAAVARALTQVAARVREGATLADALAAAPGLVPPIYRALVRAGESSGDLAGALDRLADHLDLTLARRRRLLAALAYPAVVAATTLAVLLFLVAWVLPEVASAIADTGGRVPLATRAVLAIGRLVQATWWCGAAGALLLAAAGWRMRRHGVPASVMTRLGALPLLGTTLRDAAAARAAHVLGTLLDAGVPLDAAMPLAAQAGGPVLGAAFDHVGAHVRDGGTIARALTRAAVFPPLLVRLVATGERTGTLGGALREAARLLDAEVARRLDRAAAMVEPAFVLGAGAAVLAIVLGVLLPILDFDPMGIR